jgi:tetratricopeptide (TPR) repeat protein
MYHYMRGQALKLSEQYDESIEAYSQALKLVPSLWGAYTARAGAHVAKKDYAAARKDIAAAQNILTQVIKQQPALAAKLNWDWACSYSVSSTAHEDQNDAKSQKANDVKKALEFLKKTVEAKAAHQAHIHWDPEMAPIRNEAGYKALIKIK